MTLHAISAPHAFCFLLFGQAQAYPLTSALESVARSVSSRGETIVDPVSGEEKKVKATPAQVALNWVVAKGAVPLAGVNTAADAREVAGAIGWKLRASDVAQLEKAAVTASKTKAKTEFVKLMNE
jgi:diketogulonate reductase-like aldo/keto reductase